MRNLFDRMLRASKLDPQLYEEVESDPNAMGQAFTVVILSSVAAGIAQLFDAEIFSVLGVVIGALVGWVIWSALIYVIGTKFFAEPQSHADMKQVLRAVGFASAPGVLRVFGVIPILGRLVLFVVAIWMLAATVVAVRQTLDYSSTLRAVGVCFVGWLVVVIIMAMTALIGLGGAAVTGGL